MKIGRPTKYTQELADEICETIASEGKSLQRLCSEHDHWPVRSKIYEWRRIHPYFRDKYTEAKKEQIETFIDEIIEISDDTSRDSRENSQGDEVANSEWLNRSRLRVDTRKWLAGKLCPRLYGENVLAQELAREMEEFKKMLLSKKDYDNGKMDSKSD